MIEGERERIQDLCSGESIPVNNQIKKIKKKIFEEVHFKAIFEGRDGCDKERKEENSRFQNAPILRNKAAKTIIIKQSYELKSHTS